MMDKSEHPLFAKNKTREEMVDLMLKWDRRMDETGETRRVRQVQLLLCGMVAE